MGLGQEPSPQARPGLLLWGPPGFTEATLCTKKESAPALCFSLVSRDG